jgi:hypothetical protein
MTVDNPPPAKSRPLAKLGIAVLAAAGLVVAVSLIADTGFEAVGDAFAGAGWGLALIMLYDLAALSCAGLAWGALLRPLWNGPNALFIVIRFLREAINSLLPVAQIGGDPHIVTTAARSGFPSVSFAHVRAEMHAAPERAVLLLFGTGYGLANEVIERATLHLAPVRPGGGYNHLAVRSAVAIILDRLIGDELAAPAPP